MRYNPWSIIHSFKNEVHSVRRSIFSDETNQFLQRVREVLANRSTIKPNGTTLFRSQSGYTKENGEGYPYYSPYDAERMKPLRNSAFEGRSNPKGISVLYLSNDEITSMSELRPSMTEIISCGKFVTNQELKLVDCCTFNKDYTEPELIFSQPESEEEWNNQLWFQINRMFSQPVFNQLNNAFYVPTQILSELFKDEGFGGVYFKSHLGPGINYVIFEQTYVDLVSCVLKHTKKVDYSFEDFDPREHK